MNREIAQVIAGINQPKVTQAIQDYSIYRIGVLRDLLETSKNPQRISELQGALEELRILHKIRDTALAVIEAERNRDG